MPSDSVSQAQGGERMQRALDALAMRRAEFRAAVEAAYALARAFLAAHGPRSDDRAREAALELGAFAGGRVDASRFAALVTSQRVLSPEEEVVVRRCAEVMDEVLAQGDGLFVCDVPAGGDVHAEVDVALAEAGRAFGAAASFQAVKTGTYRADQHATFLRAFPFRRWNRGERALAPPLVVSVTGADLHAGALAEYLDGRQKIVVVVRGTATPAPMARLIAPRTWVGQVDEAEAAAALARAIAYDGPAVVALVPESAARFVHDPAAGVTLAERLDVRALPGGVPHVAVGGHSAAQQREELAQLVELADLAALAAGGMAHAEVPLSALGSRPSAEAVAESPAVAESREPRAESLPPTTVDALTTWLLAQAGLPSPDGLASVAGGPTS